MVEKKESSSFFTSMKDVVSKIQSDVALGIELMKLRNKVSGIKQVNNRLFLEFGKEIYKTLSKKGDIDPVYKKYAEEISSNEKELKNLNKQIKELEEKTSPKPKLAPRKEEAEEESLGPEKPETDKTKKKK